MTNRIIALQCSKPTPDKGEKLIGCLPESAAITAAADGSFPKEVVWMPAGDHDISASRVGGGSWAGMVRCDELGASVVIASFDRARAAGQRVWLDCNHDNGAATADVRSFEWDAARGIVAKVDWTPRGIRALSDKEYNSFSPTFWVDWESGRVAGLIEGHAAGGLVNAPAFGAAMPALIAARLAGAESHANPAPDGISGNQKSEQKPMKDILIKLLAALGVKVPDDATEDQLTALAAEHTPTAADAVKASKNVETLKGELEALKAKQSANPDNKAKADVAKDDAKITALEAQVNSLLELAATSRKKVVKDAVQAAVDRGAIEKDDETTKSFWSNLAEKDDTALERLNAMKGVEKSKAVHINSDVRIAATRDAASVRVGIADALRDYAAVKCSEHTPQFARLQEIAAKRASIYSDAIAPLFRQEPGFNIGAVMAATNTTGDLAGDIITQRALTLLKLSFPALFAFSTDFSSENAKLNQTITTRTRSLPSVATYVPGTGYATSDTTSTDVDITINTHKGVEISFNANETASTGRDLFGEQVEGAHYALGKTIVDALYALITTANFTNETISALNDFNRSKMTSMASTLNARGVPNASRVALLSSTYFDKLSQDSSLVSFAAFQRPELITEYMLPRVAGFQPYEAPNLPTTNTLVGFAGTPGSLALATRVPNDYSAALPGANHGSVSVVTNPDTGISVQLVRHVDHTLAAAIWRIAVMFGVAKGQAAEGQRLVSASTTG